MAKKIDSAKPIQSDINIITALALIKQLYTNSTLNQEENMLKCKYEL